MMCVGEDSINSLKEYAVRLTTFLNAYNGIINTYVLDYFVENPWKELPASWKIILEKLEPYEVGLFLDSTHKLMLKEVWPLSLQAFRSTAFSLALPRQPVSSSKPVELFLQKVLGETEANFVNFSWRKPELEFKNKSGQHQNLPEMCRKHVKPKKQHEIFRLAQLTDLVLKKINVNHVVDIGSGLGHLSRVLCFQYNLKVATVDAVSSHTSSAVNFDKQAFSSWKKERTNPNADVKANIFNIEESCELPHHIEGIFTLDSPKEHLDKVLQQVWSKNAISSKVMNSFSLLGLHTCGDLATILLKLFVETTQAQALFSVACCYMKLNEKNNCRGYPLSNYVRKLPHSGLSYEARELCCHALEGYIQRLKENGASLKIHCYRAVLEKIIVTYYPHVRHIGLRGVKNAENMKFFEYAAKALSKSTLNIPSEALSSPVNDLYLREWKKVVVIYSLRLLLAPVMESLILLDKMIYLFENGCCSCIIPVFDPMLSPRNHVLLSVKQKL